MGHAVDVLYRRLSLRRGHVHNVLYVILMVRYCTYQLRTWQLLWLGLAWSVCRRCVLAHSGGVVPRDAQPSTTQGIGRKRCSGATASGATPCVRRSNRRQFGQGAHDPTRPMQEMAGIIWLLDSAGATGVQPRNAAAVRSGSVRGVGSLCSGHDRGTALTRAAGSGAKSTKHLTAGRHAIRAGDAQRLAGGARRLIGAIATPGSGVTGQRYDTV